MPESDRHRKTRTVRRKARIAKNGCTEAVDEGRDAVLSPRLSDWSLYLAEAPSASSAFMEEVVDLPVQEGKANQRTRN
jgi:hypothetical protein